MFDSIAYWIKNEEKIKKKSIKCLHITHTFSYFHLWPGFHSISIGNPTLCIRLAFGSSHILLNHIQKFFFEYFKCKQKIETTNSSQVSRIRYTGAHCIAAVHLISHFKNKRQSIKYLSSSGQFVNVFLAFLIIFN